MAEDNSYEQERQRIIAENAALLAQLGLDHFASTSAPVSRSRASSSATFGEGSSTAGGGKRKSSRATAATGGATSKRSKLSNGAGDGHASPGGGVSTRRSTRLMGLKPESDEAVAHLAEQAERAKKELEILRHAERRVRKEVMTLEELVAEEEWNGDNERTGDELNSLLASVASTHTARPISSLAYSDPDAYATPAHLTAADTALRQTYRSSTFLRTARVTSERAYSLTIHPDPTRILVFSGDKRGIVGVWDANARDESQNDDEPGEHVDGVKRELDEVEGDASAGIVQDWTRGSGKVWRMQVHQRSAISCLRVDPTRGDTVSITDVLDDSATKLFTSAYDCSMRTLSLANGVSTAIYALPDPDALINHFDISPSGNEIWAVDSLGGLSHVDMREDNSKEWVRRRWIISGQRTNTKIGGVGINPMNPSLICTASNDRTMRIWDTRHLQSIRSHPFLPAQILSKSTEDVATEEKPAEDDKAHLYSTGHSPSLYPTVESAWDDDIYPAMQTKKHAGLLRTESDHEKSCSAAYWDPAGRRVLTTCYDDRIRVYDAKPSLFKTDAPLQDAFNPELKIGNMKKRVTVYSGLTGSLIADLSHPSLTAVPAVTATHPNIAGVVVGANASGKCHLWGPAPLLD
ncbi:hypothetical protein QFC19_002724 [Naganishia cerealis]|uniref:Uncharacterized protein n=1 Tax=Naganishia cerealis TaxID=610337 RepID=A0ACC2W8Q3_9TREE|nr:hypothetical protein QFC19_002724 [Naganishia cerealis]